MNIDNFVLAINTENTAVDSDEDHTGAGHRSSRGVEKEADVSIENDRVANEHKYGMVLSKPNPKTVTWAPPPDAPAVGVTLRHSA